MAAVVGTRGVLMWLWGVVIAACDGVQAGRAPQAMQEFPLRVGKINE